MKTCRWCAEEIQDEAVICRYCGRAQGDQPSGSDAARIEQQPAIQRSSPLAGILALIGSGLLVVGSVVDFGDTFSLVNFDLGAGQTTGDLLFWWLPAGVGVAAGILAFSSSIGSRKLAAGASLAIAITGIGGMIAYIAYGASPGLGFVLSLGGGALLLASGILLAVTGSRSVGSNLA